MNKQRGPVWYKNPWSWLTETQSGLLLVVLMIILGPLIGTAFANRHDLSLDGHTIFKALFGALAVMVVMYAQLGSPLNWWHPFFGHVMTVNKDKIARREQAGETAGAVQQEIRDWVKEMAKTAYYEQNPYSYKFLKKADAAMFKLAWG